MNLVLFATAANLPEIEAFVRETAVRQKSPVNGCLCVMHAQSLPHSQLTALVEPIAGVFATRISVPCNINYRLPEAGQVSTMFSRFYLTTYTRYPGPWLIVDGAAIPKEDDFFQLLAKQHAVFGGKVTGRAVIDGGSVVPIGPVVISVPARDIKFLSYATRENWRQRGQYYFGRMGFGQVPPEQFLFTVNSRTVIEQISTPVPSFPPKAKPAPAPPSTDMTFVNPSQVGRGVPSGAAPLDPDFLKQGIHESFAPINAAITHPPRQPVASPQPKVLVSDDFADKKAMLAEVERLTGTRPHHATGEAKLLDLINNAHLQPS